MLRLGLNLVYLVPGETGGMEEYARQLIPELVRAAPDLRITTFINREAAEAGGGPWGELVPAVTVRVRARRRTEWVRGEQQHLPLLARRAGVDLLHSLASTSPVYGRFRRIVTIHDLNYKLFPESHFGSLTLGMRVLVPLAARRSHRVIAISRNTRDDLVRLLRVDPAKIDVVPQGPGAAREQTEAADPAEVRREYDLGDRRVALSPSAKRPTKNLARLLQALALVDERERPLLVLPGYPTPHEDELRRLAGELGISGDVRFPGWIPASHLETLYEISACCAFPSLYEGFGFPVLEAMARGVPVACSANGSLAEVSGTAAVHFDPYEPQSIANAISAILADASLARGLAEAGRRQAASFSWARTAAETLASYRRAFGG